MTRNSVYQRLRAAARLGMQARRDGKPLTANPYPSPAAGMGKQWHDGWHDEARQPSLANPRDPNGAGIFT